MKISTNLLVISVALVFYLSSGCTAELRTLIYLAQNEKEKERAIRQELERYSKLKNYILNRKINLADSRQKIVKKVGIPNLEYKLEDNTTKLVYFGGGNFLTDKKIYLFFDQTDRLIKWEFVE